MRSSTRIHCVISLFSPATKPLQADRSRHARSSLTAFKFDTSPSITYQQIPFHRRVTFHTQPAEKQELHRARLLCHFPAVAKSRVIISPPSHTSLFSTKSPTMSSDDAYMSFLDKANADLNAGRTTQQGVDTAHTETVDATAQIPTPLQSVGSYYISETDEPFEPVVLFWKGSKQGIWPSPDQLSGLISPNTDLSQVISTLTPSTFDPKNQYSSALHAVRSAAAERDENADQSAVEVKVYRVELSSTKIEYWLLALDVTEGRVVGLRAKAVET